MLLKCGLHIALAGALLLGSSVVALGDNVRTDYNHQTNFSQYHTYSWGRVKTKIPFYPDRIKQEANLQFQARGGHLRPGGGGGAPGRGQTPTTTTDQRSTNLVIDMFESNTKNLLWRGLATADLSTNQPRNTKSINSDLAEIS